MAENEPDGRGQGSARAKGAMRVVVWAAAILGLLAAFLAATSDTTSFKFYEIPSDFTMSVCKNTQVRNDLADRVCDLLKIRDLSQVVFKSYIAPSPVDQAMLGEIRRFARTQAPGTVAVCMGMSLPAGTYNFVLHYKNPPRRFSLTFDQSGRATEEREMPADKAP